MPMTELVHTDDLLILAPHSSKVESFRDDINKVLHIRFEDTPTRFLDIDLYIQPEKTTISLANKFTHAAANAFNIPPD